MKIDGIHIKDSDGRVVLLRGCNLGGSSKVPSEPPGATWQKDSLNGDPAHVSFVGKPFPLEEADEHLDRLQSWGFNFVRFVITWEAIEHAGPGIYDESYLAYLRKILKKMEERNIAVYMDPHQDVWSRWTGGDGAPRWTLEAIGINPDALFSCGAAITQQESNDNYPSMIWPVNYSRYASATMFTLFFAGNTYAPECFVEDKPVQDWLQQHYLDAMRHCYRRLKNCKAIAGWGIMNEPHPGFIGYSDINQLENCVLKQGPMPSAFQAMAAASGYSIDVPVYNTGLTGIRPVGTERINPEKIVLFRESYQCPWKQASVWTDENGKPRILHSDHFSKYQGRAVDFINDFLKPFMLRFIQNMREVNEQALFFVEGVPNSGEPRWLKDEATGIVNAFHWYDGLTLFTKSFKPWFNIDIDTKKPAFGRKNVENCFRRQLLRKKEWSEKNMGGIPGLLGEFGLPFDMNSKHAYRTGNYRLHEDALTMYYNAIDSLLLHCTIWNYSADNSNEYGDNWNNEDLSIWSNPVSRAEAGWRRPYPIATAGIPLEFSWIRNKKLFRFRFMFNPELAAPCILYLPELYFGTTPEIELYDIKGNKTDFRYDNDPASGRLFLYIQGQAGEYNLSLHG